MTKILIFSTAIMLIGFQFYSHFEENISTYDSLIVKSSIKDRIPIGEIVKGFVFEQNFTIPRGYSDRTLYLKVLIGTYGQRNNQGSFKIIASQGEKTSKKKFNFEGLTDNSFVYVPLKGFTEGDASFVVKGVEGIPGRSIGLWVAEDPKFTAIAGGQPTSWDANFEVVYIDKIPKLLKKAFRSEWVAVVFMFIYFSQIALVLQLLRRRSEVKPVS